MIFSTSLIRQDYYNLMSVYLDSVFHPLLREQDFLQVLSPTLLIHLINFSFLMFEFT